MVTICIDNLFAVISASVNIKIPHGINQIWCYHVYLVLPGSGQFPDGVPAASGT